MMVAPGRELNKVRKACELRHYRMSENRVTRAVTQLILRKTATEPGTLGQFSAEHLSHCTVVFVQDGNGRSIWQIADDLNSPCAP